MTALQRLLTNPAFDLWWSSSEGMFRLQSPGRTIDALPGIEFSSQNRVYTVNAQDANPGRVSETVVDDAHGRGMEMRVTYQVSGGLTMTLAIRLYPARPFALVRVIATNSTSHMLNMRRFFIKTVPGGVQMNVAPTGFFSNGWQSWSPSGYIPAGQPGYRPFPVMQWLQGGMIRNSRTPAAHRSDRFWSESVGALISPREALIAGGASLMDQFVQVYADLRPGHVEMMLQSQADDVPLQVGSSLASEWFYLEWIPLPNIDPLAQYAYATARHNKVNSPRPGTTGWCSWYMYGDKLTEGNVIDNLASVALLADEVPLDVVQIDDGYQQQWGDWYNMNARFDHDMGWLADRIRGSRFKPGVWIAPLVAHPKSQLARNHPDWLLKGANGKPVYGGWVGGFRARALDASNPGVINYLRDLTTNLVKSKGYAYLKLDFMYAGALRGVRHNPRLTRAQALRRAYQAIRESAGPETYILGCGSPMGPALGLVDAMRIGPDTAPHWAPKVGQVRRLLHKDQMLPSLRNSVHNVATRAWMHNRWWVNDPDCLLLRTAPTELTQDEVLAQVTLAGLSGGSMFLSDDLDELSTERKHWVAMLYPNLLDGMDVADLFENPMPETVVVPVARPWGRWKQVGLFNWSNEPVERALPRSIPYTPEKAYHLVDFWEKRYFRMTPGAARPVLHIPAHGAVLLSLRPVKAEPHLVSTTFHISQGAELTHWQAGPGQIDLGIDLKRLGEGAVWLALPKRPADVRFNGEVLPEKYVRAISVGVWSINCKINRNADISVRWEQD